MSQTGIYRGVVRTTADPTGSGRVRLQVPQVSGTALTGWVAPIQSGGAPPSVGQQVWVFYEGGDVSYPVYVPPIPVAPVPMPPLVTTQVSEPDYATTGAYVAFAAGEWPSISFTVPPSGVFIITVGARVKNTATSASTAWATWRIDGDAVRSPDASWGISCAGSERMQASRRHVVNDLPAGSEITVTPCWNISSYVSGSTQVTFGELIVERIGNE